MSDLRIRRTANVGELREALKDLPPYMLVIQSRDEEGNGFLSLTGVRMWQYLPQQDEVSLADDKAPLPEHHTSVCLWPAHDWQHAQRVAEMRRTDKDE